MPLGQRRAEDKCTADLWSRHESRSGPPYFAGTLTTVDNSGQYCALLADLLRDGSGLDVHAALEWNLPGVLGASRGRHTASKIPLPLASVTEGQRWKRRAGHRSRQPAFQRSFHGVARQ